MSHIQEVSCAFTYVKHFSLKRNIILIKSSLLHISVEEKKSPAHYPSFISVCLRTLMTLAVTIFNKLD